MHVYTIDYVAKQIGENLELIEAIAASSDNIDYGEMIDVVGGPDEYTIAFTIRGIENLQEFITDVRNSEGGAMRFLIEQRCDPDIIRRIMTDETR